MIRHKSPISGIASFEDKYIATSGYDNNLILWDFKKKEALGIGVHDHLVNDCSFSACGSYLLSSSSDYTARLWDVRDMKLLAVFSDHTDDVETATFSLAGDRIATASRDHNLRIFNLKGVLEKELQGHSADVLCVKWIKEDKELISSGDDGTIRVWEVSSGKEKFVLELDNVETDTFEEYDGYIYAGNDKGEIKIIKNYSDVRTVSAHEAGIKSMTSYPQERLLVTSSYDYKVKVWKIEADGSLSLEDIIECPPVIWMRSICFIDKNRLAFGSFGDSFALYNRENGEWDLDHIADTNGKNAVLCKNGHLYSIGDSGKFYEDESILSEMGSLCNFLVAVDDTILTAGQTGEIFDAFSSKVLYKHYSPLNCAVHIALDNKSIVVFGTYTGEGLVFEFTNKSLVHLKTVELHENAIKDLAFNDNYLFSVCADTSIAFHDLADFQLVKYIKNGHERIVNGAVNLNKDTFASIGRDKKLVLWHEDGSKRVIDTPHTHSIKCISCSKDGRVIATGGYNGRVCLLDTDSMKWIKNIRPTKSGVSSLTYCPDTDRFIASSYDSKNYEIDF